MQTICTSSSSSSLRAGISRIGIDTLPAIFAVSISHGSRTSSKTGAGRDLSASHSARAGAVRFCIVSLVMLPGCCSELEARGVHGVLQRLDIRFEHVGDAELLFVDARDDLRLHDGCRADEGRETSADLQMLQHFLR